MPATMPRKQPFSNASRTAPGLARDEFEFFVVEYAERLLQVARRLMKSQHDAEDALQDALVSAFQARVSFQGQSTVYTWLYKIVVNACLMKLRSTSKRTTISLDAQLEVDRDEQSMSSTTTRYLRNGGRLERTETNAVVRACIQQLPENFRTVLVLRDLKEFDTEQAADCLGLSCGAVKTRLHRARQALRLLLEGYEPL